MKLTESMVRDLVVTDKTAEQIGDLLTMVGFEIEEITFVEGEPVLDINIMANRGDGASSLGIAREILAKDATARPTALYERLSQGMIRGDESEPAVQALAKVMVVTPLCSRFTCRVFEGVSNPESPDWLQERLRKIGQRPISLIVDLTNYVMIETGQPMHAYDLDKLPEGTIIVREALTGEKLTTLNGDEHALSAGQMMICDQTRPIGVAGVMGGLDTEVGDTTTRCLLESAHFDHESVRKTRKQLSLQTDASYRFERYVDPEGSVRAMNRFAELLEECLSVKPVAGVIDVYPVKPVRKPIRVRAERCSALLGMQVTEGEVRTYLSKLGCSVIDEDGAFQVTPPSWRIDLNREDDLAEEVGRMHGYERIPEALLIGSTPVGGVHGKDAMIDAVRRSALACGLTQAISYSMRDVHPLDSATGRTLVRNPHSPELANLRNSLLPGLADAALRNGGKDIHLFETGRVFAGGQEKQQLAVLSIGKLDPLSWPGSASPEADFFSLKGVVEHIARTAGVQLEISLPCMPDERLHPTRQAMCDGIVLGQIHPLVAQEAGLSEETFLAEIDLELLYEQSDESKSYRPIHKHPAARRDIAILIDQSVPYSAIEAALTGACGDVLEKHWLFDVYAGKGIEPGHHSLAIALQFRKNGNFTDEEANQVRDRAVSALEGLGARLRS